MNQDQYNIVVSTRKNKKYDVFKNGKYFLSFGAIKSNGTPYSQYFDKIGNFSKYNHLDEERKRRYYARHGKDAKPFTSKWFSHHFLWS